MFAATRLIPLILSIVGFVGYLCLLASVILGMFGIDDGFVLYTPGALFELAFPIWLFVKGFNTSRVSG